MAQLSLPKGRDLGTEYSKTLSAQLGILPNMLAAQADYAPLQASAQLGNLSTLLLGTPGGDIDQRVYTPGVYVTGSGKNARYSYGDIPAGITGQILYPDLPDANTISKGGGFDFSKLPGPTDVLGDIFSGNPLGSLGGLFGGGGKGKDRKTLVRAGGYTTTKKTLAPQRGLLDIYTKDVQPALMAGDVANISKFGPQTVQSLMEADPELANLINKITAQAGGEMGMGSNLTPSMLRQAQQSVRSRQTGMLGGTGSAGDLNEAMGISAFGQQLKQQRMANASGAAGLRQSVYQNPMLSFLGKSAGGGPGAVGQAMGVGATGTNFMNFLNPESSYAGDVYNTNFNALVNGAIAKYNGQNALIGAGISAAGSLAGGAMGAI